MVHSNGRQGWRIRLAVVRGVGADGRVGRRPAAARRDDLHDGVVVRAVELQLHDRGALRVWVVLVVGRVGTESLPDAEAEGVARAGGEQGRVDDLMQ